MAPSRDELIGRDSELGVAAAFLNSSKDGGRALLLEGEAGIGKTRLWTAIVESAAAKDHQVLRSAPAEAEADLPFGVLGDLLDPTPDEAINSLSDPLRTALDVALFRAPALPGPTDQLAVSTAFLRVVRHLAANRPVLLAVDDVQWVDSPSLRVLAFAIHRLERDRVKIIASMRVPTASGAATMLQKSMPDGRLLRLAVGPLPLSAIDDLLLRRLERPLLKPELERVYSVSGGNPYFALEVGQYILEHAVPLGTVEPLPLPTNLVDALKGRITQLPGPTRALLVAVAAMTRPDDNLLRQLSPRAGEALEPALRARVLERTEDRIRFTHPLLASVVYSLAAPDALLMWHSRLAAVLNDPEQRARHLALAATGPDAMVAEALESAARSANARGAPDTAASLARQASDLTPASMQDAAMRRRIMTAEYRMRAGDIPGARSLLREVLRSWPEGKRPAEALRLMGSLTLGGDNLAEAEAFLIEALAQVGDDVRAEAIIERDLITILLQSGKRVEAADHSRRLTAIAMSSPDPSLLAFARRFQAMTESALGPSSAETRATAIALAEGKSDTEIDDHSGGLHPLMLWGGILKWADDFAHARSLFKRALSETEGRDESLRAPILFHLAEMECWAGDWLLAAVYLRECERSVLHAGLQSYDCLPLNAEAMLCCCRGEMEQARAAAEKALATASAVGNDPYVCRSLATLGAIELVGGNPGRANEWFDRLRSHGGLDVGRIRSEGDEAEALVGLGRLAEAESILARFEGYDDPWERAIGARIRALLAAARGDTEAATREFTRAVTAHVELSMPLERGRTVLAYGTALRRAKQKRAARENIERAIGIFESLGANAWLERAKGELSRIGPAAAATGELTPTESRIADLVAAGRTNKAVAAEMFLSVKTVEANLSRIYEKLGIRSRSELVVRVASRR